MSLPYNGRGVAKKIVKLARASNDGLVGYKKLWSEYYPGEVWNGNHRVVQVMAILDTALCYCVRHPKGRLPIITTIVVGTRTRKITPRAKNNIFNRANELRVNTGTNVEAFYQAQLKGAEQLVRKGIP